MDISGSIALVTGANGGMGRAFVVDLLLVPLALNVTDANQVAAAAAVASDVTLLINNAGYAAFEGAISGSDLDPARWKWRSTTSAHSR